MTRQDLLRYFNRKLKTFVASNYKMSSALFCVLRSIVCGIVSVKALAIPYIRPNPPIIVIIGGAKLLDIDTGRNNFSASKRTAAELFMSFDALLRAPQKTLGR
jgi:hypothetical protein